LRFRFRLDHPVWKSQAARDFLLALALLGVSLYLGLRADGAARRGEAASGIVLSLLSLLIALIVALTLVPRLARRVKFSSWLMPMSFSITREGGLYILSIFLLSLAAINTGNNLLFLILATLLSAIVTSGSFARASLKSLFVSVDVPENVFVGERVSIKVSLRNSKHIFPSFSVSVEDSGKHRPLKKSGGLKRFAFRRSPEEPPGHRPDKSILRHAAYFHILLAGERRSVLVNQSFPSRGKYTLEGFRLSTRFPFGFFQRGERVRAEGDVLVYPRIQEVSSYFHLLPFLPGHLEGRHVGLGESLYALRKYREGESARRVDWKATAKTGELMAREYAREEESRFCLILDNWIHPSAGEDCATQFEKAVSLAASLAAHFTEEGAELEYFTPEEYVARGIGPEHLYRILRSLAVIDLRRMPEGSSPDLRGQLTAVADPEALSEVLSEKVFKIVITSKPRGSFSSSMWHSSHVIYFNEL
jgi:uncharacterized protein (DUF58 family)